jgi:hypothetical protein
LFVLLSERHTKRLENIKAEMRKHITREVLRQLIALRTG